MRASTRLWRTLKAAFCNTNSSMHLSHESDTAKCHLQSAAELMLAGKPAAAKAAAGTAQSRAVAAQLPSGLTLMARSVRPAALPMPGGFARLSMRPPSWLSVSRQGLNDVGGSAACRSAAKLAGPSGCAATGWQNLSKSALTERCGPLYPQTAGPLMLLPPPQCCSRAVASSPRQVSPAARRSAAGCALQGPPCLLSRTVKTGPSELLLVLALKLCLAKGKLSWRPTGTAAASLMPRVRRR